MHHFVSSASSGSSASSASERQAAPNREEALVSFANLFGRWVSESHLGPILKHDSYFEIKVNVGCNSQKGFILSGLRTRVPELRTRVSKTRVLGTRVLELRAKPPRWVPNPKNNS